MIFGRRCVGGTRLSGSNKAEGQPSKKFSRTANAKRSSRGKELGHAKKSAADLPAGKHLCITLACVRIDHHFANPPRTRWRVISCITRLIPSFGDTVITPYRMISFTGIDAAVSQWREKA
jgi:hypothetical protein